MAPSGATAQRSKVYAAAKLQVCIEKSQRKHEHKMQDFMHH